MARGSPTMSSTARSRLHGALGVTADTPLEKMYRDARYARLYDGPDEVHRMVVARRFLKDCTDGAPWAV